MTLLAVKEARHEDVHRRELWPAAADRLLGPDGGRPAGLAVALALALSIATTVWRLRSGSVKSLEIAALAFFALLGVGRLAGSAWAIDHAVAASFAGLGVFSLAGAALGKPWTAEYSRGEYADVAHTPEFVLVNRVITGLWA